jgi:hypothetical protein
MARLTQRCLYVFVLSLGASLQTVAQQTNSSSGAAVMPRLIRFAGLATGDSSQRVAGITFSLYREESGGVPLWMETQSVSIDEQGRYEVLLGSTKSDGIPMELFTSGEARWLGIRADSGAESPRVLLVSVPYAVKALDAEMLGGKPPAAFALAGAQNAPPSTTTQPATAQASNSVPPPATITGAGTVNFIPKWTGASTIGNSLLFQTTGGHLGIGTTSPGARLDVPFAAANLAVIRGTSNATSGGIGVEGVTGTTTAFPGNMVGVMGLNHSKFGTAGLFNTTSINSWVLQGQYNGQQVFAVDPTGRVIANTGLFTTPSLTAAVTGYSTFNNCINTNACNFGYLGGGAGVTGVGGANNTAGLFNSQGGGLILEGTNSTNTDIFTVANNGFVHTGSLLVDGINNTDVEGVEAFAFGTNAIGVYGEADSGGNAGLEGYSQVGTGVIGIAGSASALAAHFAGAGGGFCNIDYAGNFGCTGSKSAVVPLHDGRHVALYAVEAPENWFEDFGGGQLKAGTTIVLLDPQFADTVNSSVDYHVFVTPNGECHGLYVTAKTANSFEVRELNGGRSNISFDYRIVARRKGYETVRMQDLTKQVAGVRAAAARRPNPPRKTASKNP